MSLCCSERLAQDCKTYAPESTCWNNILSAVECDFINTKVFREEELVEIQSQQNLSRAGSIRRALVSLQLGLSIPCDDPNSTACLIPSLSPESGLSSSSNLTGTHGGPLPCWSSPLSDHAFHLPCSDFPRSTGPGWRGSLLLGSRCCGSKWSLEDSQFSRVHPWGPRGSEH